MMLPAKSEPLKLNPKMKKYTSFTHIYNCVLEKLKCLTYMTSTSPIAHNMGGMSYNEDEKVEDLSQGMWILETRMLLPTLTSLRLFSHFLVTVQNII